MSRALKLYITVISFLGASVLVFCLFYYKIPDVFSLLFFMILGMITESQSVAVDDSKSISVSLAITVSAMVFGGTAYAVWVTAFSVFGMYFHKDKLGKLMLLSSQPYKIIVNISNYAIWSFTSCLVYFVLGGKTIGFENIGKLSIDAAIRFVSSNSMNIIASLIIAIAVNILLIAIYFYIVSSEIMLSQWVLSFLWSFFSLLFIGLTSVIIIVLYAAYGWFPVLIFFAPLMLARYVFVMYSDLRRGYFDTIKGLVQALEAKDKYTHGHSERVQKYCEMIADELKISAEHRKNLLTAAILHDIGKIGVKESILNKTGSLDKEEFENIKKHPAIGAEILSGIRFLNEPAKIIKDHHVYYDGKGYTGDREADLQDVPFESLILGVADAYDAMTSERPYRLPMTQEQAITELKKNAGTQFHPAVVDAFEKALIKEKAKNSEDHHAV